VYFFSLYIPFFTQYTLLQEEWFEKFSQEFQRTAVSCKLHRVRRFHDWLLFSINAEVVHEPKQILATVGVLEETFLKWARCIDGYVALLDYSIDEKFNPLHDHILMTSKRDRKNCILITNSVSNLLQVDMPDKEYQASTLRSIKSAMHQTSLEQHVARDSIIRYVRRVIISWLSAPSQSRLNGIVYGEHNDGNEIVVAEALRAISYILCIRLNRNYTIDENSAAREFTKSLGMLAFECEQKARSEIGKHGDLFSRSDDGSFEEDSVQSAYPYGYLVDGENVFAYAQDSAKALRILAREYLSRIHKYGTTTCLVCQIFGNQEWDSAMKEQFFSFLDDIDEAFDIRIIYHTDEQDPSVREYLNIRWYHALRKDGSVTARLMQKNFHVQKHLVYQYLTARLRLLGWIQERKGNLSETKQFLSFIPKRFLRILFFIQLLRKYAVPSYVLAVLERDNITQGQVTSLIHILSDLGLVLKTSGGYYTVRVFSAQEIEKSFGKQKDQLKRRVAQFFAKKIKAGEISEIGFFLSQFLGSVSLEQQELLYFYNGVLNLEYRRTHAKDYFQKARQKSGKFLEIKKQEILSSMIEAENLLLKRESFASHTLRRQLEREVSTDGSILEMARMNILAGLFLNEGENEVAVSFVKKILGFQNPESNQWINRSAAGAHVILGRIAIQKRRYKEAESYFKYAYDLLRRTNFFASYAYVGQCRCAVSFHTGRLQSGYEIATELHEKSLSAMQHEWALYFQFLQARFQFELGRYDLAYELLTTYSPFLKGLVDEKTKTLFSMWAARCILYRGNFHEGASRLHQFAPSSERSFFLAEAYFMQRQYDSAFKAVEEIYEDYTAIGNGFFSYSIGGNSSVELVIPEYRSSYPTYLAMFRAMILSYLEPGESVHILVSEISKKHTEDLAQSPYAPLGCFFGSEALLNSGASNAEGKTLLSRAVTAFKERLSQIYHSEARLSLAKEHYWYKRLQTRAHEFYIT